MNASGTTSKFVGCCGWGHPRSGARTSFDCLARHYYWMECVLAGRTLQRCRNAFLNETRHASKALLIGEGNGRFLAEFLTINKTASVLCVDSSLRMLEFAKRRAAGLAQGKRVQFAHADLLEAPFSQWENGSFDLVVTNFFLDCFRPEQLDQVIATIGEQASPGATWLLADFRVPVGGLARIRAKAILWLAYTFFRIATGLPAERITTPDPFLERNGFFLQERRVYEFGLLHSDLWRARQVHAENFTSKPATKFHPRR